MAVTIRALEELVGQLQLAERVEVAPTLVIGLGGSGTWTARRLKKLMQQRYGKDISLIRFLFVDCDQGAFASEPELADVQDDEKVALVIRNPWKILQGVRQGIGDLVKWQDWLPEQLDVGILRHAIGAGGIRPVGRFALFASLQEVWRQLNSALREILAIEQQLRMTLGDQAERVTVHYSEPRIYIVGSLCGGTGSSLFLDIAVLVRHCLHQIAPDAQPYIVGVFFLPSVFANDPALRRKPTFLPILQANGYAALKELEHFCDGKALQNQPFIFRYSHREIGDVTVDAPVYDEAFVVEDGTPDGRHLNSKEEVFEMVARSLLVDIGSPFGSRLRSERANIETGLRNDPCPLTKKARLIHSLGMTSVAVPIAEIVKRGALRWLRQFLTDHALGQELSASELEREVNEFLQANKLEERGNRNELLERLSTGEVFTYTLPRTREELEREAGGSELQQAHYVATWIEQEMNRLRTQLLPEAKRLVQENQIAVLKDATTAIANRLKEKGLRAARQFVGELYRVFQTVCDELRREQEEYDRNIGALENAIANHVAFLRGLQGLWGSLKALWRVDEQAMDEALRCLQEYGNAELLSVARKAALELLGSDQPIGGQLSLLRQLKEWEQALEQAIGKLNELERRCGEGLHTRLPSKPTGSTSNSEYVLEQWVIQPEEFDAYLQDIALDPATYRDALWQELGGDFESVVSTLREKSVDALLEELAQVILKELAQVIGKPLRDALADRLNILRVIQEKRQQFETILRAMLQVCQPFWRAPRDGIGGVGYLPFFAITVPVPKDESQFRKMEQIIQETAKEFGYQPVTVHSGYPFAIEIGVRFYGARAFWITTTALMRRAYEQKRQFPDTAGLLHIDRRFLDLLPDLYEGVQQSG